MANLIQPGADALGWRGRLREGAYTSPSGTRIRFEFEDLQRNIPLRSTAFSFPGVDGDYVQQNGFGSRRYPMRLFFSGPDHDLVSTAFEAALSELGRGRLEHPMYGLVPNVVPMGEISRRDDLKNAANQTVIEVEFWTTLTELFPSTQTNPASEIVVALGDFDVAAAQQFAEATELAAALERASLKETILETLDEVSAALQSVADTTASVRRGFADIQQVINRSIDVLVGQPLLLAQQMSNLIKFPARAAAGIQSRMDGYRALAQSIFTSEKGLPAVALMSGISLAIRTKRIANDFHASDLSAMNAVGGSVESVLNNEFTTRPEAIRAAASVVEQFDELVAWRDSGFEALEQIRFAGTQQVDTGAAYTELRNAVSFAAGFLVEISFTLVPERRIILDRNRTILDLASELYGSVDDSTIERLITTNDLTGDQILELRAGESVVYYPS